MATATVKIASGVRLEPVLVMSTAQQKPGRFTAAVLFKDVEPGVQQGDQIVAINGKTFKNELELFDALKFCMRGEPFELSVQRGEAAIAAQAAKRRMDSVSANIARQPDQRLGLGLASDANAKVIVQALSHQAAKSPLALGDQIVSINGKSILSLEDARVAVLAQNKLAIVVARPSEAPPSVVMQPPSAKPKGKPSAPAVSPSAAGKPEELTVVMEYDEGEDVGCRVHDLVIDNIVYGSIAEQLFKLGDKILQCNGRDITSDQDFYSRVMRGAPKLTFKLRRTGGEAAPGEEPHADDKPSQIKVKFTLTDGEAIGITPHENLKVVKVQPQTIGAEHFHPGDIITTVNGSRVRDLEHLNKLIDQARPHLEILVDRSKFREEEMEMRQLPTNIEQMITRHAGYEYQLVDVKYDDKSGRSFGLGLANCAHNRVIVTSVKDKSVAADHFKVYDRILTINGMPVTDENVAKEYICAMGGNFQACVERPKAVDKWHEVKIMYATWRAQKKVLKAEDQLPSDAMLIAADQKRKYKTVAKPAKSVLRKAPMNPSKTHRGLTFTERPVEVPIVSDVPANKQLRKCS